MNKTSKYRKKNKRKQGKKAIRFMTQVLNSFVSRPLHPTLSKVKLHFS